MINKRLIIGFWILLLVPALIITGVAFRLLLHEQERISRSVLISLTDRARSIARTIHTTILEVEDRLSQSLIEIDPGLLERTLVTWEQTNPLVRNVFIWHPDSRLEYPAGGMASTLEERQFIDRFDSFFSKKVAFDATTPEASTENPGPRYSRVQEYSSSSNEALYDLAKGVPSMAQKARSPESGSDQPVPSAVKAGWIPWFSQNHLHILGWVQKTPTGPVYGIELELVSLLSRLVVDLPVLDETAAALAILDSNGQVIYLSGDVLVDDQRLPDISVALSRLLPHWQVCIYLDREAFAPGRGFLYVSILLLLVFLAAIVSGGVLLTRQSVRSMKEAMQKTTFVSSVSHELKTPLTSIRMYAELLQSGRVTSDDKRTHYLSVMVAESQRLTRLINNVLDFSKLEQKKKTYQKTLVDLKQMLVQMIDAHGIRIQNEGVEIQTDIGPGEFRVMTDPDAVEQVVLNLVDNALKYAAGGRYIGFVLEKSPEDQITLKICDHGPGIAMAHQKAIFDTFYRIDNTLTSVRPGSGLGLSIARRIIRDLGGDLFYEPMPGGGSCFIVRIPII